MPPRARQPAPAPLAALAVALAALGAACAHGPAAAAPAQEVRWPAAPASPRAHLLATFPDPAAPAPARSFWAKLRDLVTGIEHGERPAAWLARPFGVAASADGAFVIADPDRPSVVAVDARGEARRLECKGRDWKAPMAAALAPDGATWIADGGAGELVRIAPSGACRAIGAGLLERPTGLALDGDRLWVADPPRHAVVVLSGDGRELLRLGGRGEGAGELHFPTALALAPDGTVVVVDALNFRVARFAADGRWLGAFGLPGDTAGNFNRPKGVAVDAAGALYVTDAQRDVVAVFRPDGAFEVDLGAPGTGPGELTMPAGVAVAGRKLYVADSQNQRVLVFALVGGSSP